MKVEVLSMIGEDLYLCKDSLGCFFDALKLKDEPNFKDNWSFPLGEPDDLDIKALSKAVNEFNYKREMEDKLIKEGLNADQIVTAIRI